MNTKFCTKSAQTYEINKCDVEPDSLFYLCLELEHEHF